MATSAGQLVIDGGSSVGQSRGHDHADALSVCLHGGGRALLIDPGTCEYVGPGGKRNLFRGTAMHNTLRVDSCDQAEPDGPFSWKQHFQSRAEQWIAGKTFDLFVGSHDGYNRLPSPVLHRRWVVALRSGIFLVRDRAIGNDTHRLDISWHLSPELRSQSEQLFRFNDSAQGLAILPVQGHAWMRTVQQGQWSPAYGQESAAMVLNFGASVRLPAEFVSVLVPLQNAQVDPGALMLLQHSGATEFVHAYRYELEGREHDFFFGRTDQPWKSGPIFSDAEFVCISSQHGHDMPRIIFCNGSYVEIAGSRSVRTPRKVQRFEWTERGQFCSDAEALKTASVGSPASQKSTP